MRGGQIVILPAQAYTLPMSARKQYATWVEVDLGAIGAHVRYFKSHTGVQVMAVVKANAYGHGAIRVARAARSAGADWLAVARVEEALELRAAGIEAPILILGYTPPDQVPAMIAGHISMTVWEASQVDHIARAASAAGVEAQLHLKVDTGMNRLGVKPDEALALAQHVGGSGGVALQGLFTHFARADEADSTTTDRQAARFAEVVASLEAAGLRPPVVHCSNSAAALTRADTRYDLVRIGIAMYGLRPSAACPLPGGFRPALTWKTVLSRVASLPPGEGVSYGHVYVTRREERIGTAPVGYADGFRRVAGNEVLVGGVRVPVVGRVTMDQIMLQLDAVPEARAGDEVVLIGGQGGETITADEVAAHWGTINYEVTSAIMARVPRRYP